ncbi:hypothetical protein BD779DRAFT_787612 [Infundibulicybe gibba]|nr:hypothetical protein BD779DRAFT_787612 [Infundibulicybe gibba]
MGLLKDILSFFSFGSSSFITQPTKMVFAFPLQGHPAEIRTWRLLLANTISDNHIPLSEIEETRVERLELWKERKTPYHEFLLVYITTTIPGVDVPVCIRIERTLPSRTPAEPNSSTSSIISSNSPAHAQSIIGASGDVILSHSVKGNRAYDSCQQIATPTRGIVQDHECQLLKTSTFQTIARPTIIDLVATAEMLSNSKEEYHLLKGQCYWYAGVLLACMEDSVGSVAPPTISIGKKEKAQLDELGRELVEEARATPELKQGHYKWISVFKSEKTDVSELREPIAKHTAQIRGLVSNFAIFRT